MRKIYSDSDGVINAWRRSLMGDVCRLPQGRRMTRWWKALSVITAKHYDSWIANPPPPILILFSQIGQMRVSCRRAYARISSVGEGQARGRGHHRRPHRSALCHEDGDDGVISLKEEERACFLICCVGALWRLQVTSPVSGIVKTLSVAQGDQLSAGGLPRWWRSGEETDFKNIIDLNLVFLPPLSQHIFYFYLTSGDLLVEIETWWLHGRRRPVSHRLCMGEKMVIDLMH